MRKICSILAKIRLVIGLNFEETSQEDSILLDSSYLFSFLFIKNETQIQTNHILIFFLTLEIIRAQLIKSYNLTTFQESNGGKRQ